MDNQHNPYKQPISDISQANDDLCKKLPTTFAFGWWREAWRLFWARPFTWLILTIVLFVVGVSLVLTKYLSPLLLLFLLIYVTGLQYVGHKIYHHQDANISDWLTTLSERLAALLALLLMTVGLMVALLAILPILVFVVGFIYNKISSNDVYFNFWFNIPHTPLVYLLAIVMFVGWVVFHPVLMAVFFAPMLVMTGHKPISAMRLSFYAYKKNFVPLTVFGLLVVLSLAVIMLLMGYAGLSALLAIWWLPMIGLGALVAYCQIFDDWADVGTPRQV